MDKVTVNVMDYQELDKLVNDTFFGGEDKFCFAANEEMANDTDKLFQDIDGVFRFDFDEKNLNEYLAGKETFVYSRHLLNELCRRGKIETGNYLIRVSW